MRSQVAANTKMRKRRIALAVPGETRIVILRQQRVIRDSDLAQLYGVPVGRLNEQVKRNHERFPTDFMFQLTAKEDQILRSQNAISRKEHGGRRYLPYVFTEHGAIMAATVLNSRQAIQMSVFVVRVFSACASCSPAIVRSRPRSLNWNPASTLATQPSRKSSTP